MHSHSPIDIFVMDKTFKLKSLIPFKHLYVRSAPEMSNVTNPKNIEYSYNNVLIFPW